jgi:LysR family transcriptional regulator, glycine cleavage system transcriptional activator
MLPMKKIHAQDLMKTLPPLGTIKAFEASARHASFTKAADELFVTQGAISKQIKLLEEYLGVALFERRHQHLLLTKEGQLYMKSVCPALESIADATRQLRSRLGEPESLHINILPSLSSRWLIPLLDGFKKKYPAIDVIVTIGDGAIDFNTTNADIAIRVAKTHIWKPQHAEIFMGEELIPVCSPQLKSQTTPLENPKDLLHYSLLQHTTRPDMWADYVSALGYKDVKGKHGLGFEHFFMLIQAAEEGLGIALIPKFLIEKELASGRLVLAFNANFQSPYNYYLVYPKQKAKLLKIKNFKKWIRNKYPL